MKKRSFEQRVTDFLNGKGFYIALAFCALSIVLSCWYLWREFTLTKEMVEQVSTAQPVTIEPEPAVEADQTEPLEVPETDPADEQDYQEEYEEEAEYSEEEELDSPETENTDTEPENTENDPDIISEETMEAVEHLEIAETLSAEQAEWLFPVKGQVVAAFSADALCYNEALGDWRSHRGIDLRAVLGEEVIAACAGTVTGVDHDLLLGQTVTVDCGSGILTRYSNLAEEVAVAVGDNVTAGELLGTVGETAVGETNDGAWLHFSVSKGGEEIDPMRYLKQ